MPNDLPPVISSVQVSPASGPGGTVFLASVTASDFAPLSFTYQWKLDGVEIVGATGAGHIASAAGQLTVLVTATGDFNSDSRESASVQVSPAIAPPAITEARILPGAGVVGDRFAAIAEATGVPVPELSYQWMCDGVAIVGATAATHTAVNPGALSVRVIGRNTEGSGSRDSGNVVLAAQVAPTITSLAIAPLSGPVGTTFEALVAASGNPAPVLSYQWLRDGAIIAGTTGASHLAGAEGLLSVRVTATNSQGSDTLESSVQVFLAFGAPVADPGPHNWNENEATGFRTFDAAARFSVPGDPTKASVTYGLMAGGSGGPFLEGVLEDSVFVGQADGYVSIDPALGVLSIDTGASGPLAGVAVVVRASNAAGYGDLTITLTVAEAWSPAQLFAAAGAAGAYLDARDDAMFQEHAGTAGLTPADANLEPIGTVAMTTGSPTPPIYARAANGTTGRPLRREEGGAVSIEWNGSSAQRLNSIPLETFQTGWHIFAAVRRFVATGGNMRQLVAIGPTASSTEYFALGFRGDVGRAGMSSRSALSGRYMAPTYTATNNTLPADTDLVVSGYLGIGTQKMWVNNSLVLATANDWTGTEAVANACLRIDGAPAGLCGPGVTYAALAYKPADRTEISAELMASIQTYLIARLPS